MTSKLDNFKAYSGFIRRYGRRFISERYQETRVPVLPAPYRPNPAGWPDDRLTVAWLGHATVLINFFGVWLLTDPALRLRIGPNIGGITVGPRRLVRPALTIRELPPIDAMLISHAHMDHCDKGTLMRLPRRTAVVTQQGVGDLLKRFHSVKELAWGQAEEVKGVRIEAIEVNHWGARKLTDRSRGYGGFLISKGDCAIVFGGDTAYTRAFAPLKKRARIRLAILPIGAYDPYIMVHCSPEQAWSMRREMGAEYILGVHHSTFRLSREPAKQPVQRLLAAASGESWRVVGTEIGETWSTNCLGEVMAEKEGYQNSRLERAV